MNSTKIAVLRVHILKKSGYSNECPLNATGYKNFQDPVVVQAIVCDRGTSQNSIGLQGAWCKKVGI
jgi:hypothetical protein